MSTMFSATNISSITGGTFNMVEGDFNVQSANEKGRELLHEKIAPGAFHNSAERSPPPKCHPATRKVVLREIMDWTRDRKRLHPFLWLSGQAGSGKSSIAQTIAEMCEEEGILAASFFFSRIAEGRNSDTRFIATLAYQLTISVPETLPFVASALNRDAFLFSRSLQTQMGSLIIEPLKNHGSVGEEGAPKLNPGLIIIDGLDECGQPRLQNDILNAFASAVLRFNFPLYFLITSRPEYDIRDAFDDDILNTLTRRIILDEKYDPNADIRTFLQSRCEEIKKRHPLKFIIPSSWPSEPILDYLIRKSSGLFIYASTVIKFIQSPSHWPTERLEIILGLAFPKARQDVMPFADLDVLYTHIFTSVDDIERVLETFTFLLFTQSRLVSTTDLVEDFLFYRRGDLQLILSNLHSVIDVPPPIERLNRPELRILHALGDFLTDSTRSRKFFISPGKAHASLARYCIKHMSPNPTFSMLSHHLISHFGLMQHCLKAHPTKELLRDLYHFEFERFLDVPLGGNFPRTLVEIDDFFPMLPLFLQWIQRQNYPNHNNDLYLRYLDDFNSHIKKRLSFYPQESSTQHLFTASTLPEFLRYTSVIWDILGLNNQTEGMIFSLQETDQSQVGLLLTSGERSMESWGGYYTMLTEFFIDTSRSGTYYVGISSYLSLAMKSVDFLAQPNTTPLTGSQVSNRNPREAEQCTLDLLVACLLRVPMEPKLAVYLRESSIGATASGDAGETDQREVAFLAIQAYIKECENQDQADDIILYLDPTTR